MKKKLLVVDDEKAAAELLVSFFKTKPDIEPIAAFTLEDAISLIKIHKPEILIVDLNLAGKSGLDVIRHAKEIIPASAIIVVTGLPDEYLEVESQMLGAEYFLEKPIKIEELAMLVEKIMKELS